VALQNQPDLDDTSSCPPEIGALSHALGEPGVADMSTGWQPFPAAADRSDSMVSCRVAFGSVALRASRLMVSHVIQLQAQSSQSRLESLLWGGWAPAVPESVESDKSAGDFAAALAPYYVFPLCILRSPAPFASRRL
jgi:hypothetical protein